MCDYGSLYKMNYFPIGCDQKRKIKDLRSRKMCNIFYLPLVCVCHVPGIGLGAGEYPKITENPCSGAQFIKGNRHINSSFVRGLLEARPIE